MKKLSKLVIISSLVVAGMFVYADAVSADTNQVNNNNTTTVTCTTGNYGTNNCSSTVNQSGTITVNNEERFEHKHVPVATGMDTATTAATVIGFITTTGGAILTWKSRMKIG